MPALALAATGAAFLDLFYWRLFRIMVLTRLPADTIQGRWFVTIGPLPMNLAVLCGTIALVVGLVDMLRSTHFAPVMRRTSLAAFLGIFGAALIALLLIPAERTGVPRVMVIVTMAAGAVLATLITASSLVHPMRRVWRLALFGGLFTWACTLLALVFQHAPLVASFPYAEMTARGLRRATEVGWLVTPVLCAPAVLASGSSLRTRVSYVLGFSAFMASAFTMGIAKVGLRSHFADALYYTMRVELLVEAAPLIYSPLFGIAFGAGCAGLTGKSHARRQGGAALILWLCAGTTPPMPGRMLMLVLATMLLARAAVSDTESD
jgi:hypothetical protein